MSIIGIDYTPAYDQGGGIGRYVRELVHALAHTPDKHNYRLFVAGASAQTLPSPPAKNFVWKPTPVNNRWLARLWHKGRIPLPIESFIGNVDLYHATDFVLPPSRKSTRTILTVHDLSYIRTPETASPRLQRYLETVVPRSIQKADHILADSTATQSDIVSVYGVEPEKITVLLSGVGQQFEPVRDTERLASVRRKYQIGEKPFVFAIGTVQPRKNYARLTQAIAQLHRNGHDVDLVIAGGKGWLEDELYKTIDMLGLQQRVHLIGYADELDIPALYSASICSAFVSLYEGFGLPILESMACGTPVITSNISSMPEVAGHAAITVDPTNVNAISDGIERIITETRYRDELTQRGFSHIQQFTWEKSVQTLLNVYDQILTSS